MRATRETNITIVRVPDWPETWHGWRFAHDRLICPEGRRISPERLQGLLWRQEAEARRDAARARKKRGQQEVVTVLRIRQADWHRERFGTVAG